MLDEVDLALGASAFRVSNPPPWLACLNKASLEVQLQYFFVSYKSIIKIFQIFDEAGMDRVVEKQYFLTGYLELLIRINFGPQSSSIVKVEVITPKNPDERGAQLSLSFSVDTRDMYAQLKKKGVVVSSQMRMI